MGNKVGENMDFRSVGPTKFSQRSVRKCMHQTIVSIHTWRGHMVGQACLNRRRVDCEHKNVTISGHGSCAVLDEKSREKALAEEMKKKYGTGRGTRGIIIKRINNVATQMGAKILACMLLRKCCREEVPAGFVVVATQCAEGTTVSCAPYLLNIFLDDYKDV
jgi:hypothetical protein